MKFLTRRRDTTTPAPTPPTATPVVYLPGPMPEDIPPAPAFRDAWSNDPDRTTRQENR